MRPMSSAAPTGSAGSRRGTQRTSSFSTRLTGVTSPTISAPRSSRESSSGAPPRSYARRAVPTRKQRRRQQKARRHEYEYVYVDDEGNEVEVDPAELPQKDGDRSESRGRRNDKRPAQQTK